MNLKGVKAPHLRDRALHLSTCYLDGKKAPPGSKKVKEVAMAAYILARQEEAETYGEDLDALEAMAKFGTVDSVSCFRALRHMRSKCGRGLMAEAGAFGGNVGGGRTLTKETRSHIYSILMSAHNVAHGTAFNTSALADCAMEMITAYAESHSFSTAKAKCLALGAYLLATEYMVSVGASANRGFMPSRIREHIRRRGCAEKAARYKRALEHGVTTATCKWTAFKSMGPAGGVKRTGRALRDAWNEAAEKVRERKGRALDLSPGSDDYEEVRRVQVSLMEKDGYEVDLPEAEDWDLDLSGLSDSDDDDFYSRSIFGGEEDDLSSCSDSCSEDSSSEEEIEKEDVVVDADDKCSPQDNHCETSSSTSSDSPVFLTRMASRAVTLEDARRARRRSRLV